MCGSSFSIPVICLPFNRGRYTIQIYPSFIGAHGKTFDYKIPFNTVTRLFLLPHNDQRQMFFVVRLQLCIMAGLFVIYYS